MPLRIPTGWSVRWNGFFEAEHPSCVESQDLLWVEQVDSSTGQARGPFVDLGWYGGRDDGKFRLVMLDGDWSRELARFESRERGKVVEILESWLREK